MSPTKVIPFFFQSPADAHDAWACRGDGRQSPADAHDACASCCDVTSQARLMLMMLGVFVATESKAQLALVMLGFSVARPLAAKPGWCFVACGKSQKAGW